MAVDSKTGLHAGFVLQNMGESGVFPLLVYIYIFCPLGGYPGYSSQLLAKFRCVRMYILCTTAVHTHVVEFRNGVVHKPVHLRQRTGVYRSPCDIGLADLSKESTGHLPTPNPHSGCTAVCVYLYLLGSTISRKRLNSNIAKSRISHVCCYVRYRLLLRWEV